jgi:hypothetical protein
MPDPASSPAVSCACRRRATTARRVRRAAGRSWCGSIRRAGCRSRSAAACGSYPSWGW